MGHGYACNKLPLNHQDTMDTTPDKTRLRGDKTPNIRETLGIPHPPVPADNGKASCLAWHTKERCNETQRPREHGHVQCKRPSYAQIT